MGLKSNKNFIVANAVENILARMKPSSLERLVIDFPSAEDHPTEEELPQEEALRGGPALSQEDQGEHSVRV